VRPLASLSIFWLDAEMDNMKELRMIEKTLNKSLNNIHTVTLLDGTHGILIDWEIRIAVVDPDKKGRQFATTKEIKKIVR
jgi:hypothetical protein